MSQADPLLGGLSQIVGPAHVLTDPALTAAFTTDWTRRFSGAARAVVRPADTAELAAVLRLCSATRTRVQVQGGNTGLVGGSVPAGGEVLLSTGRLDLLGPVDTLDAQVTVGAGATLSAVTAHVLRSGLDVGIDLAARESATIGGLVATNAGGERVLRHGTMRAQVAGVEAVLADGTVLTHLAGLAKDNTGYDLAGLLAGSEGTLAVLTAVRLRLVPLAAARAVALAGVADTAAAQAVLGAVRAAVPQLSAAELCFADGIDLVRGHTGLSAPLATPAPAYLLLEAADGRSPLDALAGALAGCPQILDAVLADDPAGLRALWRYREAHTEAISAAGVPVKLDVSVPAAALAECVARLPGVVSDVAPTARLILFGHIAEGNLHVNVLDTVGDEQAEAVTEAVLRCVAGLDGSISAEHGIGRAKARYLLLSRSAAEVEAMRALKRAWDPAGLLNPGVLFSG